MTINKRVFQTLIAVLAVSALAILTLATRTPEIKTVPIMVPTTVVVTATETLPQVTVTKTLPRKTVTQLRTKTATVTHSANVPKPTSTADGARTNLNTHGMNITWDCYSASNCSWGVTNLTSCHVWIKAPKGYLQDVLDHEYVHVRQCQTGWWRGKSINTIERVADAGALCLGADWVNYTYNPTTWERQQAGILLGRSC